MPHSHPRPNPESQWLASSLSTLLKSPHIVLDESPLLPLAPGPVDIFSTRFNQLFAPDARGYVCGKVVERDELKETLLGLQRRWNAADSSCAGCVAHPTNITEFHPTMAARLEFTPLFKYPREQETIMAEASGEQMEGHECIKCLMLQGDETLFHTQF